MSLRKRTHNFLKFSSMMLKVEPKALSKLGKHMPGPRVAFKPKVLETGSKGKLYEDDLGSVVSF